MCTACRDGSGRRAESDRFRGRLSDVPMDLGFWVFVWRVYMLDLMGNKGNYALKELKECTRCVGYFELDSVHTSFSI